MISELESENLAIQILLISFEHIKEGLNGVNRQPSLKWAEN